MSVKNWLVFQSLFHISHTMRNLNRLKTKTLYSPLFFSTYCPLSSLDSSEMLLVIFYEHLKIVQDSTKKKYICVIFLFFCCCVCLFSYCILSILLFFLLFCCGLFFFFFFLISSTPFSFLHRWNHIVYLQQLWYQCWFWSYSTLNVYELSVLLTSASCCL